MASEPPPSRWVGVLVMDAGAIPIGAALLADDANLHGPRWLVGMVGGMFVLAGVMIARAAGAASRSPTPDVVGASLGVLLTSGFTVLSGWALFFSGGPQAWSVSGSLPLWLLPAWVGDVLFYILMGICALLCVVMALYAWRQLYRVVAAGGSGPPGARGLQ
ncbi:MAG TPA: hypothetical protein VIE44_11535 [Methylomirabilota bacterium]